MLFRGPPLSASHRNTAETVEDPRLFCRAWCQAFGHGERGLVDELRFVESTQIEQFDAHLGQLRQGGARTPRFGLRQRDRSFQPCDCGDRIAHEDGLPAERLDLQRSLAELAPDQLRGAPCFHGLVRPVEASQENGAQTNRVRHAGRVIGLVSCRPCPIEDVDCLPDVGTRGVPGLAQHLLKGSCW